jgi:hypothetical protein
MEKPGLVVTLSMAAKYPELVGRGRESFDVIVVPDEQYREALENARASGRPVTEYALKERAPEEG